MQGIGAGRAALAGFGGLGGLRGLVNPRMGLLDAQKKGGGSWSPIALGADVVAWFDASDATTFSLSGSFVTQWRSKVGSFTLVPDTASTITFSAAARNNKPGVVYNGSNWLQCSATGLPTGASPMSMGGLGYHSSGSVKSFLLNYGSTGTAQWRAIDNENVGQGIGYLGFSADFFSGVPWNSDAIIWANVNGSADVDLYLQQSGVGSPVHAAPTVNVASGTTLYIGASSLGNALSSGDVIQELLFVNRPMTMLERQHIEGYLAWKYNCVSALPPNHPFIVSPP